MRRVALHRRRARRPELYNNKIFFDQLIARVRYPTVGVFFLGDEYEPADRGIGAAATLTKHGVPNLIIDHPPGLFGPRLGVVPGVRLHLRGLHRRLSRGAPNSPLPGAKGVLVFHRVPLRGDGSTACRPHDQDAHFGGSHGKFAVYPTGDLHKVISADKTEVKGFGIGDSVVSLRVSQWSLLRPQPRQI